MRRVARPAVDSLHVAALWALAVAQPLFDLLGRNPEFFAVRHSQPVDILVFALAASLGVGVAYLPVAYVTRRLMPRSYDYLHAAVVGALMALLLLPVLHQGLGLPPWPAVVLSLGTAVAAGTFYRLRVTGRRFMHLLSPSVLLLPAVFLFHGPVNQLLVVPQMPHVEGAKISGNVPVVVLIFDELPLSSLIDLEGKMDANLFPGFAAFAAHSTCYPNAHSVAEYTTQAVPAILTGRYPVRHPDSQALARNLDAWLGTPTAYDYPYSLFTALGPSYEMRVVESLTSLCPEALCPKPDATFSAGDRVEGLFRDLAVVYVHILLPKPWTDSLPPVDLSWADFAIEHKDDFQENDAKLFQAFIEKLEWNGRPTLYLHHSTLPHSPWTYLPSGKRYGSVSKDAVSAQNRWSSKLDSRLGYQRHLLQTRYADSLLAQAIDRIRQQGFFDQALIAVTADHGASFRVGASFREVEPDNATDIVNVPLCIKYPGQTEAVVSSLSASTVDLMPTIMHSLGGELPWSVDGEPLQTKGGTDEESLAVYGKKGEIKFVQADPRERARSVKSKVDWFGQGDPRGVMANPYPELMGKHVSALRRLEDLGGVVEIDGLDVIAGPGAHRHWLPALIKGRLRGDACEAGCPELVLVVNEYVAAVLHPLRDARGRGEFAAVVSDTHLREGGNELRAYSIERCDAGPCFAPWSIQPANAHGQ